MPIIIDGNNLLHSLPKREQSRKAVRQRALETVRHEGVSLTVVFDGPPPAGSPALEHLGRVSVQYSGTASADDVIVNLLPKGGRMSEWIVVTDDRGLRDRIRERGAQVRTLGEWRGRRRQKPRRAVREPKLSSREIEEWESYFGTVDDVDG
jgi:predicted RNA-binding protein with PIN domain